MTVAESGAIIDYLARKYSDKALIPEPGTEAYRQYTYWLHFAEGTLMPPMVADVSISAAGAMPGDAKQGT